MHVRSVGDKDIKLDDLLKDFAAEDKARAEADAEAERERARADGEAQDLFHFLQPPPEPELKGSVGEGPNQTNYSDQSSVRIFAKFRNFR